MIQQNMREFVSNVAFPPCSCGKRIEDHYDAAWRWPECACREAVRLNLLELYEMRPRDQFVTGNDLYPKEVSKRV